MTNTSNKKYRLLKDLPDYKAGEIFEWNGTFYAAKTEPEYGGVGQWPRYYVENCSDWFELIQDPISEEKTEQPKYESMYPDSVTYTSDKNFDVRLKSLVDRSMKKAGYSTSHNNEKFMTVLVELNNAEDYLFATKSQPSSTPPENKSSEPMKDRDWKIILFQDAFGAIWTPNLNGLFENKNTTVDGFVYNEQEILKWGNFKIRSVRRLSDSEVFSIGEEVRDDEGKIKNITGFELSATGRNIEVKFSKEKIDYSWLWQIKKPSTPTQATDKERIEVKYFDYASYGGENDGRHILVTTESIPAKKFPAIKQAIEQVLND